MSEFVRNERVEDVFNEMHGIKPRIEYNRLSGNVYKVKISLNGKECILTETMKNGLTASVALDTPSGTESHKSMFNAEKRAVEILRS